jgi:hypothetical protein
VIRSPPSNPQRSFARSNRQPPRPRQEHVPAVAQDGQIDHAVAVDVERIGAGRLGQVGGRIVDSREMRAATGRRVVPVQRGRMVPAGQVEVRPPVAVAVEHGHAATDRERVLPSYVFVTPDEAVMSTNRGVPRAGARGSAARARDREAADDRGDDRHDHDDEGGDAPRTWPHRREDSEGR